MADSDHPKASIGDLVSRLTEQLSGIVRGELELLRNELAAKAKLLGAGAGAFALAGALAFFALGVLISAAVLGLAEALPAWLAALIIGVVLLAIAAGAVAVGVRAMKRGATTPEKTVENVQLDVDAVKRGLGVVAAPAFADGPETAAAPAPERQQAAPVNPVNAANGTLRTTQPQPGPGPEATDYEDGAHR